MINYWSKQLIEFKFCAVFLQLLRLGFMSELNSLALNCADIFSQVGTFAS